MAQADSRPPVTGRPEFDRKPVHLRFVLALGQASFLVLPSSLDSMIPLLLHTFIYILHAEMGENWMQKYFPLFFAHLLTLCRPTMAVRSEIHTKHTVWAERRISGC
jgi:hypothetical protein